MTAAPIDIVAEHALCRSLSQAHIDALITEGVPSSALLHDANGCWSLILRDRLVLTGERFEFARYRSSDNAVGAFILIAADEFGEPADLIAWRPGGRPSTWLGRAGLVGAEMIYAPRWGAPLSVFDTVLDWLRAGRDGVVIVDPARAASLLREAGRLQVSTHAQRRRLEQLMTVPPPRIEVTPPAKIPMLEAAE